MNPTTHFSIRFIYTHVHIGINVLSYSLIRSFLPGFLRPFFCPFNRPFPSSLVPLFQGESKRETILMKMTLISMKMKLHAEPFSYERFRT